MTNIYQKSYKDLIEKYDWDILIILDACRYDIFSKIIFHSDNILSKYIADYIGKIGFKMIFTGVSDTVNWLFKYWSDFYDLTYISGNPYINNFGIGKYSGKAHFSYVDDAWDYAFKRRTGRISPEKITKTAIKLISYAEFEKFIIHYMQPHSPYIFKDKKITFTDIFNILPKKFKNSLLLFHKFYNKALRNNNFPFELLLTENQYSKLYTIKEIYDAYTENLVSVIKPIYNLVSSFPEKRIIVTSDHAEYLGEYGRFGHGGELTDTISCVPLLLFEP